MTYLLAFLGGMVTIVSPCSLPVLPILLGNSTEGKARAYGIVTGFTVSFTILALLLGAFIGAVGIDPGMLRIVAAVALGGFSLVLLVPAIERPFERFASMVAGKATQRVAERKGKGFPGGLVMGAALGLIWSPCVGPVMGSVLTAAATGTTTVSNVFTAIAFSVGSAIPMLGVLTAGRAFTSKLAGRPAMVLRKVFALLALLTAVSIAFNLDRTAQSWLLDVAPWLGDIPYALENALGGS